MMNFWIDSNSIEDNVIRIQSRFMSDPTFSDIDFRNKMALAWTTLQILRPSTLALLGRPLSLFRILGSSFLSRMTVHFDQWWSTFAQMTVQFGSRTSTFARPSTLSTFDFHLGPRVISKFNQKFVLQPKPDRVLSPDSEYTKWSIQSLRVTYGPLKFVKVRRRSTPVWKHVFGCLLS